MKTRCTLLSLAAALITLVVTSVVHADGPTGDLNRNKVWHKPLVEAQVETRRDGVYIVISVRQTAPGNAARPSSASAPAQGGETDDGPPVSMSSPPSDNAPAIPVRADRTWRQPNGLYRETADGHRIYVTPPSIGGASLDSWIDQLRAHPNHVPYLIYVDDQLDGIAWIPNSADRSSVQIDTQPSSGSQRRSAVPGGDADSTDPLEVALYALGHAPLPPLQPRVNPSLGLVNLPGWFWVDGYDGRPFGVSRTVHVPPEVGDDVPIDVVPADDPRRHGSSFTVAVRLWPGHYEWDFGDGQFLVTESLGRFAPSESDIQHTYEHSSLGLADGFPVRLMVTFNAEYRINGGPPQALPSITQMVEYGYPVQEAQSVLTGQ